MQNKMRSQETQKKEIKDKRKHFADAENERKKHSNSTGIGVTPAYYKNEITFENFGQVADAH